MAHASHGEIRAHCRLNGALPTLLLDRRVEKIHVRTVRLIGRKNWVHLHIHARHAGIGGVDALLVVIWGRLLAVAVMVVLGHRPLRRLLMVMLTRGWDITHY